MKSFLRCALVTTSALLARGATEDANCFLRKTSFASDSFLGSQNFQYRPAKKPFPSLTQCYKNNQLSCCVSAHDAYIESQYASILSSTCLREYQLLENYFCLGCYPDQGRFLVKDNTTSPLSPYKIDDGSGVFTLRICKSFVEELYNPRIQGSYNYDNCGLLDPDTGEGYLPRERYANYSEFIEAIKPPYFEKVKWLVIDDDASTSYSPCFSASTAMQMGIMTLVIVSLAHLFH